MQETKLVFSADKWFDDCIKRMVSYDDVLYGIDRAIRFEGMSKTELIEIGIYCSEKWMIEVPNE
jgi:hypothetical protein